MCKRCCLNSTELWALWPETALIGKCSPKESEEHMWAVLAYTHFCTETLLTTRTIGVPKSETMDGQRATKKNNNVQSNRRRPQTASAQMRYNPSKFTNLWTSDCPAHSTHGLSHIETTGRRLNISQSGVWKITSCWIPSLEDLEIPQNPLFTWTVKN